MKLRTNIEKSRQLTLKPILASGLSLAMGVTLIRMIRAANFKCFQKPKSNSLSMKGLSINQSPDVAAIRIPRRTITTLSKFLWLDKI